MGNPLGGNPAEIFQKLSTDPRTSGFMSDPTYLTMLQELSSNPGNAMKYMNDPRMQATLQGTVACLCYRGGRIITLRNIVLFLVMFGVNLGADKDGNPEVIPDPSKAKAAPKPQFDMEDMDTSGPTETKKSKTEPAPTEPAPMEEESGDKAKAKALKEEGNALYKESAKDKSKLDQAIEKYQQVSDPIYHPRTLKQP